jgi:hypothetical protein
VEVYRLANAPDLLETFRELLDVRFTPCTTWADVRQHLEPGAATVTELPAGGGYAVYQVDEAVVHVVADPDHERGQFPGRGDLWSISISRPQ